MHLCYHLQIKQVTSTLETVIARSIDLVNAVELIAATGLSNGVRENYSRARQRRHGCGHGFCSAASRTRCLDLQPGRPISRLAP